jgi:diguanylate cyclase
MAEKNPSDIARETLRALAARKLSPTPEHFTALFHEISGLAPPLDKASLAFIALLNEADWLDEPARQACLRLSQAGEFGQAMQQLVSAAGAAAMAANSAGAPPRDVTAMADDAVASSRADLPARGLPSPPGAPEASSAAAPGARPDQSVAAVPGPPPRDGPRASSLADLLEQVARLVEFALPALGDDDPRIGPEALALVAFCREQATAESLAPLRSRLANFNQRLSFVAEEQAEVRAALLGMLRLVFENIAELSLDDRWIHAQIEMLMSASAPPLSLRRLDDVQRRLKDVIFKQGELKRRAIAVQEETKHLLATFIEKLSVMAELSGAQHHRIDQCARRIESARDLADLGPALAEAISATRMMALHTLQIRDELSAMRRQASDSETELARLRRELDAASSASRHDPLTGALNRKGLDEALEREISRARRLGSALSIALLDIDNFKTINDMHGHPVGDAALSHLATIARSAMRAQDSLSRYGGEEFVIVMPDTELADGIAAMQNLQRELTRHFFMAGSSRILITFSAGVAMIADREEPLAAIDRADKGMYQAKRSGKNKVVGA